MAELLRIGRFVVPILAILSLFFWKNYSILWFNQLCAFLVLPIVAWFLGSFLYDLANVEIVSVKNKAIFITGCDTGFGNFLAKKLCDLGKFL